jgi:hypothetical protein
MYAIKVLIIVLVFAIIISISQVMIETFVFDLQSYDNISINPNILMHSVPIVNTKDIESIEKTIIRHICGSEKQLFENMLKYGTDMINWSKWYSDESYIQDTIRLVFNHINRKLDIIYYKLNRYKYDKQTCNLILMDFDIVSYGKSDTYAKHTKFLSIVNLSTQKIYVLYLKIVGTINQDKIYETGNVVQGDFVVFDDKNKNIDESINALLYEDTCKSMQTQDEQAYNILYINLMKEEDDATLQNMQYEKNQNIVKNMLRNQNCAKKLINNPYRNYPYTNDFVVR